MSYFEAWTRKARGSPAVLAVLAVAFMAIFVGATHFAEDTHTSYVGLIQLEFYFGMRPALIRLVYLTAALTPQIGQIVFTYNFLATRNRWAAVLAIVFLFIDVISDVQSHSGGMLFPLPGVQQDALTLIVTTLYTLIWFTFGSELFLAAGLGIALEVLHDAAEQSAKLYVGLYEVHMKTRKRIRDIREATGFIRNHYNGAGGQTQRGLFDEQERRER